MTAVDNEGRFLPSLQIISSTNPITPLHRPYVIQKFQINKTLEPILKPTIESKPLYSSDDNWITSFAIVTVN